MDEEHLIRQSQAGDLDSFNRLVELHQGPVYNLSLRLLGQPQAAEDATQEAFLSAFQAIKRFRGGSLRAWLFRIAANACYDEMRRSRRRPATSLEALTEGAEMFPSPSSESPEEIALRRELAQAISQGLSTLPPEQRLAVILSDIQGLSYEEMAQAMGSSLGTVKSRLSRGRARLSRFLAGKRELLPRKYRLKY